MPRSAVVALLLVLASGPAGARDARAAATTRPAIAPRSAAAPAMVLPFIDDDYPKAVALARERKLPLFVESWAPW